MSIFQALATQGAIERLLSPQEDQEPYHTVNVPRNPTGSNIGPLSCKVCKVVGQLIELAGRLVIEYLDNESSTGQMRASSHYGVWIFSSMGFAKVCFVGWLLHFEVSLSSLGNGAIQWHAQLRDYWLGLTPDDKSATQWLAPMWILATPWFPPAGGLGGWITSAF